MFVMVYVCMMVYILCDIVYLFLCFEMVECVVVMLNYFLFFFVGFERRKLKIKNFEKYGWEFKEFFGMIIDIYV